MTIRERTQEIERQTLSSYACFSDSIQERATQEPKCDIRTEFQRDRDRILHCNSFRRLKHKTQVFLSPLGDHYRTRLTHTLEVAQIGRTVARALRLNEDLTEAIALGHDLGHTPFGHCGEYALREICPHGFVHADQSVRVAECLEKNGQGLNLTREVVNGIQCHSSGQEASTLEGRLVRYADKIAYMNHDIEDAIRAGVLSENDIPWDIQYALGRTKSQRITTLIVSLVENSGEEIKMSPEIYKAYLALREFMFQEVYHNPVAKGEEPKAMELVKSLYQYYIAHEEKLPDSYRKIVVQWDIHRAVCDYISGMSDVHAVKIYEELFVPRFWGI